MDRLTSTFASRVDAAMETARALSMFVPSRAEKESALQPLVADMLAAGTLRAQQWLRDTFRGAGTPDALALALYKSALAAQRVVSIADVTPSTDFSYVAEASELGLAPGEWPVELPTSLGNRQPLERAEVGDDGAVVCRQSFGCIRVYVLND